MERCGGRHFCCAWVQAEWCGAASTNDPILLFGGNGCVIGRSNLALSTRRSATTFGSGGSQLAARSEPERPWRSWSFWRSDGSNSLSTGSYGNGMCPRNTAPAATMPGNSPAWPQPRRGRTRSYPWQAIGAKRLVIAIAYNFRKLVRLTFKDTSTV